MRVLDSQCQYLKDIFYFTESNNNAQLSFISNSLYSYVLSENNCSNCNNSIINFYPNGNTHSLGKLNLNHKIGKWIYYHKNGNVKEQGNYKEDDFLFYDGKLQNYKLFPDEFELLNSDSIPYKEIYPKLKKEQIIEQYYSEREDSLPSLSYFISLKKGKWEYFDSSGKLERIEFYKEGVLKKTMKNNFINRLIRREFR